MARIFSFPPVAAPDARVLILGSMPGEASLKARQYYAHPRNLFWPILGELVGVRPDLPYPDRLAALRQAHIALWDVLQSCERDGSLDSAIDPQTRVVNDFGDFFTRHPHIGWIFFNGREAEKTFRKHAIHVCDAERFRYTLLPSTSPANASIPPAVRLDAWRVIVDAPRRVSAPHPGSMAGAGATLQGSST